jgi:predicted O-methyltransferase YrrM
LAEPDETTRKAAANRSTYHHWIDILAYRDNRLYYRDQTPESLAALESLARHFAPTVIVELGTLGGLSLRAWSRSAPQSRIIAVDLSFATLRDSTTILPLELSRVTLLEADILTVDFSSMWGPDDRVLFFVDAHDLPDVPVMGHVLGTAVPNLPPGSLVVVDDLWHSPVELSLDTTGPFFRETVQKEIDWLQCFEGHYAPYHGGGSFLGFREVVPLLEYVNARGIELRFDGKTKNVSFLTGPAPVLSNFDPAGFASRCGVALHNPLEGSVRGTRLVTHTMTRIAAVYRKAGASAAMALLMDLAGKEPTATGLLYALAVCQARMGLPYQALELLTRELAGPDPHVNAGRLYDDLARAFLTHHAEPRSREPGLTLFAMPKAFLGHVADIQRNAIESWTRLTPRPKIILFGDEPGIAEIAAKFGLRHIPNVELNDCGTPLVDALFGAAQELSDTDLLAYVNTDIILFDDFPAAVDAMRGRLPEFLMMGRRFDFDQIGLIDFSRPDWAERLRREVTKNGILHAETGIDYFVFTPGLWPKIPPFAIGRMAWDNWLVKTPHALGKAVVDASDAITVVHQTHDYSHNTGGKEVVTTGIEVRRNKLLCGPINDDGFTNGARWVLGGDGSLTARTPQPATYASDVHKKERLAWLVRRTIQLLATGRTDLAEVKMEEALGLAPDNPALLALRERVRK